MLQAGGIAAATCAAVWLGSGLGAPVELLAGSGPLGPDLDQDGLVDVQELVSGTDILFPDVDLDGMRDLEEIARGLDPLVAEQPQFDPLSMEFAVRSHNGLFHLTVVMFLPDGDLSAADLDLGIYYAGFQLPLSWSSLLPLTSSYSEPGSAPGSEVVALSVALPDAALQNLGPVSFYATLTDQPGQPPSIAAAVNLQPNSGVSMSVQQVPGGGGIGGPGVALTPITPPGGIPTSFSPNEICFQTTELVGSADGVQIFEVMSSTCVPSTKGCAPGCSTSIGQTLDLIDPLALIGG